VEVHAICCCKARRVDCEHAANGHTLVAAVELVLNPGSTDSKAIADEHRQLCQQPEQVCFQRCHEYTSAATVVFVLHCHSAQTANQNCKLCLQLLHMQLAIIAVPHRKLPFVVLR
jgi:hypothetical protein